MTFSPWLDPYFLEFSYQQHPTKMVPILVTLLKMHSHYSQSCGVNGAYISISLLLENNPAPGANHSFSSCLARGDGDVQILYTRIVTKNIRFLNYLTASDNRYQYKSGISLNCRESELNLFATFSLYGCSRQPAILHCKNLIDFSGRLSYKLNYGEFFHMSVFSQCLI